MAKEPNQKTRATLAESVRGLTSSLSERVSQIFNSMFKTISYAGRESVRNKTAKFQNGGGRKGDIQNIPPQAR
ncbi:MAG: hypothetical protein LBL34_02710 [Clostridiales bacterium]|jgi:hypothetical protein|nr:hypothetical protein [Clostridiales bacterium]